MPRRRGSSLDLNFDGLTDAVTNLVGALVLVVVLVIAVTKPITEGLATPPPPENRVGAEQRIDQLLEKIRVIQLDVETVNQEIRQAELRIPEIASDIKALQDKASQRGAEPQK